MHTGPVAFSGFTDKPVPPLTSPLVRRLSPNLACPIDAAALVCQSAKSLVLARQQ